MEIDTINNEIIILSPGSRKQQNKTPRRLGTNIMAVMREILMTASLSSTEF